jgi:hypothetical protein
MKSKNLIELLAEALIDAEKHLTYCCYGDSWERACAYDDKLPEKLEDVIKEYRKFKKEEERNA